MLKLLFVLVLFKPIPEVREWNVDFSLRYCGCALSYVEISTTKFPAQPPINAVRSSFIAQWTFEPKFDRPYTRVEILKELYKSYGYLHVRAHVISLATKRPHVKDFWVSPIGVKIGDELSKMPEDTKDQAAWTDWYYEHDFTTASVEKEFSKLTWARQAGIDLSLDVNLGDAHCE